MLLWGSYLSDLSIRFAVSGLSGPKEARRNGVIMSSSCFMTHGKLYSSNPSVTYINNDIKLTSSRPGGCRLFIFNQATVSAFPVEVSLHYSGGSREQI